MLFSVLYLGNASGQNRIENELILQLKSNASIDDVIYSWRRSGILTGKIKKERLSVPPYNFWKIIISRNILPEAVNKMYDFKNVVKVQYNHFVSYRNVPDDSLFFNQWSLKNTGQTGGQNDADIDADLAWDLTTGGLTPTGDTIVICIIDNGIDINHPDLIGNLWRNYGEIKGNGIDDDGNGYIDDYAGWNTQKNTDYISGGNHGTSVSGIIGAKGNNKLGIAGINWNVKLMEIINENDEAGIIAGYLYALKMRRLYNETNGEKGAFVVATNTSLGINDEKAEDHPIWCSIYDSLGVQGIINIGATANNNVNVDSQGDMPSSCSSDYLLTVTNMDMFNNKVFGAGYGLKSIDLGAYGKDTYALDNSGGYHSFGGTSAATPHATGVAGLLFSYSKKLAEISLSYPQNAALMAKDAMMTGVKHNQNLEGITVSEGVLNAYNALRELEKYDDACATPSGVKIDSIGGDMIVLSWDDYNPDFEYNLLITDESGNQRTIKNVKSPVSITDLTYCSKYSIKLQTVCNNIKSKPGFPVNIKTLGCCDAPKLTTYNKDNNKLHLEWEKKIIADKYLLTSRFWSFPHYDSFYVQENKFDLDYNFDCGVYDLKLRSSCDGELSDSETRYLLGNECDICNNADYCYLPIDNNLEWIEKVSFGGFSFNSGKNPDGYSVFRSMPSTTLYAGNSYSLSVEIKFSDIVYDDYFYAWIDFNRNSRFDSLEMVVQTKTNQLKDIFSTISIPDNIVPGATTIRFLVSAYEIDDPCGIDNEDYGEYEDYCVFLDNIPCNTGQIDLVFDSIGIASERIVWSNPGDYKYFELGIKKSGVNAGYTYLGMVQDTFFTISNLEKCTDYDFRLSPYCEMYKKSDLFSSFKSKCTLSNKNLQGEDIHIYPIPFRDKLFVDTGEKSGNIKITIVDLLGQIVYSDNFEGLELIKVDLNNNLTSGFYFVKIEKENLLKTFKIIKQ